MNKKVLMINGSFRKRNTYNLLIQIGEILKKHGIESEILNLFDYEIKHCHGCDETCINNNGCNTQGDDMDAVRKKILESDAVVFGSPVYLSGVTSKFKAFADRTNNWFHNPETAGKPVLCVVTTESTGINETVKFLNSFTTGLGARKGGVISRSRPTFGKSVEEAELARFISLITKDKSEYAPAMNEIVIFQVQKVLAIKIGGEGNKQFWEEKGWTNKMYYYDCGMGFFKKTFSKMMFSILSKAIK